MKILITGTAGFIGYYTAKHFAGLGYQVIGLDNINGYYDVELKYARLADTGIAKEEIIEKHFVESSKFPNYKFVKADITDKQFIDELFKTEKFDIVCNLAAQAGVRYSIENPYAYLSSNITGFLNIIEACRHFPVKHLVYASSSSVYGANEKIPYSEQDKVDSPMSLYAATKRSNELIAHSYCKLFGIPCTGLRFFTVYGPWGRPDMAPMMFMKSVMEGKTIKVFNYGNLQRDFTYIDDIIFGLSSVILKEPSKEAPYKIYNIGNSKPVALMDFISSIEKSTGKKAKLDFVEMQPGDVYKTYADTTALEQDFGYKPNTPVQEGIDKLYKWFLTFI